MDMLKHDIQLVGFICSLLTINKKILKIIMIQKFAFLRIVLFCILIFCWHIEVNAQTPVQIAEQTKASSVLLEMKDAMGRSTQGSGFFIGEKLVATNFHVIDGAKTGTAKLVEQQRRYDIEGVTATDKDHDLAIIKVNSLNAPPLLLGNSDDVSVGEVVYAVGNPRGYEGTFSSGEISNIQEKGSKRIKGRVLQFTAAISSGSSGGAVVNRLGEVIGIVSETVDDGQNLNFAVPVNELKMLFNQVGLVKPFPDEGTSKTMNNGLPLTVVFLLMSIPTFAVIWVLPMVKFEHWSVAVGVASGFGIIKMIVSGIVRSDSFPNGIKAVLSAPPPKDVAHALGCENCILDLVSYVIKFPSYLVFIAILLGLTNVAIKKFELNGFFSTFFVAFLIIIGEHVLHLII